MRVQELVELLQQQYQHKIVCFDIGDDSVDISSVEDFNDYVFICPESYEPFQGEDSLEFDDDIDYSPLIEAIEDIEGGTMSDSGAIHISCMKSAVENIRKFLASVGAIEL